MTYISVAELCYHHDDVIKWKHFPRYWPFVRRIHRSPVNSPHKGQWRGALMFTLICARIKGWVNNCEAGDLRRYLVHYDVIVITALGNGLSPLRGQVIISTSTSLMIIRQLRTNIRWLLTETPPFSLKKKTPRYEQNAYILQMTFSNAYSLKQILYFDRIFTEVCSKVSNCFQVHILKNIMHFDSSFTAFLSVYWYLAMPTLVQVMVWCQTPYGGI